MSTLKSTDIEYHMVKYYSTLYAIEDTCANLDLINRFIPSLVSIEDNGVLANFPSLEEVKARFFAMNSFGAPG